jgi:tRNA threonylcarbamoyladenosine biosynthesis protein TsaE
MPQFFAKDEAETRAVGAWLAPRLRAGIVVSLVGDLGAGKTTFVRGVLEALGHRGEVRSPTFNLLQSFDTKPPVLHVDLYRLTSAVGVGIEDYLDTHAVLIEWPDRARELTSGSWMVRIEFQDDGRRITISLP